MLRQFIVLVLVLAASAAGVDLGEIGPTGRASATATAPVLGEPSPPSGASSGAKAACVRSTGIVPIGLNATKYPTVLAHMERAIDKGWPRTMRVNRRGADARRTKLLRRIPTKRGFDRDEYPPAVGRGKGKGLERGSNPRGWRADVEYVPSSENRSAGATMGIKLRRFCDGVRFRLVGS